MKPNMKKLIVDISNGEKSEFQKANHSAMLPQNKDKLKYQTFRNVKRMSTIAINEINKSIAHTFTLKDLKNMHKESSTLLSGYEGGLTGYSLFMFSRTNRLRIWDKKIVYHNYFDYFILVVIVMSSITLALENPLNDPNSGLIQNLRIINICMTCVFCIECLMKIIAGGFVFNGKDSYLRNSWNLVDFFIVIISVFSIFTESDLSVFKVIRVLRLLRPLRVIQRNEGLKIAVAALLMAVPNILYVSVVAILFFAIFGMTGVNMFKGRFYS